jgi:pyrimidine operon attenuation protein/uracil phosphoribosyltransferase
VLPKKVQVAVLVDRKHKRFPVCADFVGMLLSTTLQEHIEVELKGEEFQAVYLED